MAWNKSAMTAYVLLNRESTMKVTKRQLRQVIKEEKRKLLKEQGGADPRMDSDLLGKINDAVDQLLQAGMDPYELQGELESIALSVTDLDHLQPEY